MTLLEPPSRRWAWPGRGCGTRPGSRTPIRGSGSRDPRRERRRRRRGARLRRRPPGGGAGRSRPSRGTLTGTGSRRALADLDRRGQSRRAPHPRQARRGDRRLHDPRGAGAGQARRAPRACSPRSGRSAEPSRTSASSTSWDARSASPTSRSTPPVRTCSRGSHGARLEGRRGPSAPYPSGMHTSAARLAEGITIAIDGPAGSEVDCLPASSPRRWTEASSTPARCTGRSPGPASRTASTLPTARPSRASPSRSTSTSAPTRPGPRGRRRHRHHRRDPRAAHLPAGLGRRDQHPGAPDPPAPPARGALLHCRRARLLRRRGP